MKRLNEVFTLAQHRILSKGQTRHGDPNDRNPNLLEQPIITIPKNLKSDASPLLYQAVKKIYESQRLDDQAQENELLDAINYLACAIIYKRIVKDENMY